MHHNRETDLDDVLQISNVFVNVSKGEVAKSNDLKKSFGTDDRNTIAREVSGTAPITQQKFDLPALGIYRSSRKVRFRSAKRSENTIPQQSDVKSPL